LKDGILMLQGETHQVIIAKMITELKPHPFTGMAPPVGWSGFNLTTFQ